jgi:hypothetical protein
VYRGFGSLTGGSLGAHALDGSLDSALHAA